jgi:hypothetical protein
MTITTSTARLCPYIRSASDGPHRTLQTYCFFPMWRPNSRPAILGWNGSWCTRVTSREYLRTKELVAGNLGTTTGHAILGGAYVGLRQSFGCRGYTPTVKCKDDSKGQCDDLWLEDSMHPRGLREARSTGEAISEDAMFNSSIHGCMKATTHWLQQPGSGARRGKGQERRSRGK